MHKFFKLLAMIWTMLCVAGMLHGCYSAAISLPTNSSGAVSTGATVGIVIGMGVWFIIWIVPVAILLAMYWFTKPEPQPAAAYYPQYYQPVAPTEKQIAERNKDQKIKETALVAVFAILIAGIIFIRYWK